MGKNKKNKKNKETKGTKEVKGNVVDMKLIKTGDVPSVETAKDDAAVVSQLAKATEGKGEGIWKTSTLVGDLCIIWKKMTSGQLRKTFRLVGADKNIRVTDLRQQLKDADTKGDSPEESKGSKDEAKKGKKGKKDKKGKSKEKEEKSNTETEGGSKNEDAVGEDADLGEFLKKEEMEAKYKVKKATKALQAHDLISKKQAKKIVAQWGEAKKVSGTTIIRTVANVAEDFTAENMVELLGLM